MPHRAMQQQLRQRRERGGQRSDTGEPGTRVGSCIARSVLKHLGIKRFFAHISAAETGRSARMPGSCFHSVLAAELDTAAGKTKPHQPAGDLGSADSDRQSDSDESAQASASHLCHANRHCRRPGPYASSGQGAATAYQ